MSVWTTKTDNKKRNYIVMKHTLKGVNYVINGIKFRDGYAVVEKDSKTYYMLKKIPVLRKALEYPLLHLRELIFITRPLDVKTVYGQNVYRQYLEVLTTKVKEEVVERKIEEEITHVEENSKCAYRLEGSEELCNMDATIISPSKYCKHHILKDPKLLETIGVEVPRFLSKDQRRKLREEVLEKLEKEHTK